MGSDTEAEACFWATVRSWGVARTFAVAVDLLSNVHDAFVFGTNFQGGRDDNLPSNRTANLNLQTASSQR